MQKVSTNDGSPCLVSLLRSQHRVFLARIALCAIWGSTWLVIKIGLTTLPPFSFAAMRFLIAAVALFGICMVRGKTLRADRAKDYVFFALTGFLTFSVNYGLLFWGEQRVSSGLAAILQATIPLFGMAFAHFLIPAEPIKARRLIGAILGLIGVAVICAKALNIDGEVAVRGGLALVVGAASTALANVLIKSRRNQFDPAIMTAWQMSFGLLPLAIAGWVVEGNPLSFAWNSSSVACLLYLAIVGSCIAFCLFYWLINRISVTNLQAIPLITPPLAVTLGWVVIGEKLSGWALFGAVVVLAGVGLIVRTASVSANTLQPCLSRIHGAAAEVNT